jgi:hypothetical protein
LQEITREKSKLSQDQAVHSKETLDQLVLSYLIHHGYTDTAKAVVYNGGHASTQDLSLSDSYSNISKFGGKDMEERQGLLLQ